MGKYVIFSILSTLVSGMAVELRNHCHSDKKSYGKLSLFINLPISIHEKSAPSDILSSTPMVLFTVGEYKTSKGCIVYCSETWPEPGLGLCR